jgi:hypothetical protein
VHPLPLFFTSVDSNRDKVLCFDAVLQVLILGDLRCTKIVQLLGCSSGETRLTTAKKSGVEPPHSK